MLIYWVGVGIIGLLAIPKLILIGGPTMAALVPAYAIGFGVWWLTGLALMAALSVLECPKCEYPLSGEGWVVVAGPCLVFGASHVYSFFSNYLGRGEYRAAHPEQVLIEAFERVVPALIASFVGVTLGLVTMQHV